MFRELIGQSWERSKRYEVPQNLTVVPSVSEVELQQRVNSNEHLIEVVEEFIVPLQKVLKDRDYMLGLFDADGVMLKNYSGVPHYENIYHVGTIWTERYVGTTGIGLALATEKVAVVDLAEHYCENFKQVCAVGYPIFLYGNLVGILNLAIEVRDGLDYLVNLMSVLVNRVEEQLFLKETIFRGMKEKRLEEVLRTFIHEIKNPLTNIRAFMQLQQLKNPAIKQDFDKMIKEVDRISGMVDNFRYVSLQKESFFTRVNLTELLLNLHDTLKNMFEIKGWKFDLIAVEDFFVQGNENRLKQVFVNIIKNSFEAINGDGLVEIKLEKVKTNCIITISDNGEGVFPHELELVFQPFYTTKTTGYGLGLVVCREIITQHNGEIKMESAKNAGTKVTITLPLS